MLLRKLKYGISDERGVTLLEVLISTVVLGIALTGFLWALSISTKTSQIATDENQLVYLAQLEFEQLRAASFDKIPFAQTSEPGHLESVPDYFLDIALSPAVGGDIQVRSSGYLSALTTVTTDVGPNFAFDGKRANQNTKWMGLENALAYRSIGGGPGAGGPGGGGPGGGGPGAGGPGGDPGGGGGFAPKEYQYIYAAFPELTSISRILYDNRFNVTEEPGTQPGDFDYLPHDKDIWQRNFEFFYSQDVLPLGSPWDPWRQDPDRLAIVQDQRYGSGGIYVIFDDFENPLEAGIIGVHNIDTVSDFDKDFHYPYASEIEVYGFSDATYYLEEYQRDLDEPVQYDNVIMYFPNYRGSGFDMGRRSYVEITDSQAQNSDLRIDRRDLIHVIVEFYPSGPANDEDAWQKVTWWQLDTNELARFETSFYRDGNKRIDRLPNLNDFPKHTVYEDNESLDFYYTVPGAGLIRGRFKTLDLESSPGSDEITIMDKDMNPVIGPFNGNTVPSTSNPWTPWIPGDTIVIHFESDGSGNTSDGGGWGGFEIDAVEVKDFDF